MNNMVASHLTPPVREREPQESLYMDSPEVLGHALCTLVPDMMAGFCILTSTGEIRISAPDAPAFATAMETLLLEKFTISKTNAVAVLSTNGLLRLRRNFTRTVRNGSNGNKSEG